MGDYGEGREDTGGDRVNEKCAWVLPVDTGVVVPIELPDRYGKGNFREGAEVYDSVMRNSPELERQGREIVCRRFLEWPTCFAGGIVNLIWELQGALDFPTGIRGFFRCDTCSTPPGERSMTREQIREDLEKLRGEEPVDVVRIGAKYLPTSENSTGSRPESVSVEFEEEKEVEFSFRDHRQVIVDAAIALRSVLVDRTKKRRGKSNCPFCRYGVTKTGACSLARFEYFELDISHLDSIRKEGNAVCQDLLRFVNPTMGQCFVCGHDHMGEGLEETHHDSCQLVAFLRCISEPKPDSVKIPKGGPRFVSVDLASGHDETVIVECRRDPDSKFGNNKLFIQSSGNVGMNKNSPDAMLDISSPPARSPEEIETDMQRLRGIARKMVDFIGEMKTEAGGAVEAESDDDDTVIVNLVLQALSFRMEKGLRLGRGPQ